MLGMYEGPCDLPSRLHRRLDRLCQPWQRDPSSTCGQVWDVEAGPTTAEQSISIMSANTMVLVNAAPTVLLARTEVVTVTPPA